MVADEAPIARTEVTTYPGQNPIICIINAYVSIKNITVKATNMQNYTADAGTQTTIIHSTFSSFNKNGVHFFGANTTGSVDNSSFTGDSQAVGRAAQNGVVFQSGATGSVTNSRFESIWYTNTVDSATGVLSYGAGSNVTVTGNIFTNIQTPISEDQGGIVTQSGNTFN